MDVLDAWLTETESTVKMTDGHELTVIPVRIADCIIAGEIPMPALEEMAKLETVVSENGSAEAVNQLEVLKSAHQINDVYVQLSVKAMDGQPVTFSLEAAKRLGAVDDAAYAEVVRLARRETPAGKG